MSASLFCFWLFSVLTRPKMRIYNTKWSGEGQGVSASGERVSGCAGELILRIAD
jgi:hypothetical protein